MTVQSILNNLFFGAYFIRLKSSTNTYIHFEGENPENKNEVVYVLKEGIIGAAIFRKPQAKNFIGDNTDELEYVNAHELIKKEKEDES